MNTSSVNRKFGLNTEDRIYSGFENGPNMNIKQSIELCVKCSRIRERDGIKPLMADSHETREWQPHGLGHREEAERAGGSPSDHDTWLGGQWQGRVCRERESKLDYWWLLCNRKSLISTFLLQNTHRTIQNYHWEHLNWAKEALFNPWKFRQSCEKT